jgi:hypothetical protein
VRADLGRSSYRRLRPRPEVGLRPIERPDAAAR